MLFKNPIVQYIHLQLYSPLKRLFGKRRRLSSLCLLLTLFLCALLLACLSLTLGQNVSSYTSLRADFNDYITLRGVTEQNQIFRDGVRTVLAHAELEIAVTHLCLIGLWFITSLTAVSRMFGESIATEKYVYALYIIYGADTKRLGKHLLQEFWILGIPSLLLAMPVGHWICQNFSDISGFSLFTVAETLIAFWLLSLLCARRMTRRLFKESCVQLMTALDTTEYVESPRRSFIKRTTPFRLSFLAFWRMRRYRFRHALSLALMGAVLFSMTALTLPDHYATENVSLAYTLTFERGVSYESMESDYLPAIESLEAVVRTERQVSADADRVGTHLLLEPRQVTDHEHSDLLPLEDQWALNTVKIACGDGITEKELGGETVEIPEAYQDRALTQLFYTLDTLQHGQAAYVYPEQNGTPKIQIGDTVKIAVPDGTEGYDRYGEHITVEIAELVPVGWVSTVPTLDDPKVERVCPYIYEDYLFLSPQDYATVSGIPQTAPASVCEAYADELGIHTYSCYLLLPQRMQAQYKELTHVTTITPDKTVKRAFVSRRESAEEKATLPIDTYFINDTALCSGIYLGTAEEYEASFPAVDAMQLHMEDFLGEDMGEIVTTQYPIAGKSFCADLDAPCVIFHRQNDACAVVTSMETELSAMTLKSGGCSDRALYYMDSESAVVSSDDENHDFPHTTVMLTTNLPDAFVEAMEKAAVELRAPARKYQLTESRVLTSFQKEDSTFLILSFSPTAPLATDRYPAVIDGIGSYIPVTDRLENSILTLADIDSMLVFAGDPKEEREHATVLQGDLATNHFTLTTERELGSSPELCDEEAVLLLPQAHPFALQASDRVHIAESLPLTLELTQMDLNGTDLLDYQLDVLEHRYLPLTLTAVKTDTSLTAPTLVVSENTLCRILGKDDVISEMRIYVDSQSSLTALGELSEAVSGYVGTAVKLDTDHGVLQSRGTGSQRYPAVLRVMLLPLCLLLILLPLSSARTLDLRRNKEQTAYLAAGMHRKRRSLISLGEGLWVALLCGGLYALLCPFLILCIKLFCGKFHVPLKPESFSPIAFFFLFGLILLSSLWTSCISGGQHTHKNRQQKKGARTP